MRPNSALSRHQPAQDSSPDEASAGRPLVLDLDGTVVRGNLLVETAIAFLKQNPLKFFMIFIWLLRGRAELKQQLAQRANVDV